MSAVEVSLLNVSWEIFRLISLRCLILFLVKLMFLVDLLIILLVESLIFWSFVDLLFICFIVESCVVLFVFFIFALPINIAHAIHVNTKINTNVIFFIYNILKIKFL